MKYLQSYKLFETRWHKLLLTAIDSNNDEEIKKLSKNYHAYINKGLIYAANKNNIEAIKLLIQLGADINYDNGSLIHIAITSKNFELIDLLLTYSDIKLNLGHDKRYPIQIVILNLYNNKNDTDTYFKWLNVLKKLVSHPNIGINISIGYNKKRILDLVLSYGGISLDVLKILISYGALLKNPKFNIFNIEKTTVKLSNNIHNYIELSKDKLKYLLETNIIQLNPDDEKIYSLLKYTDVDSINLSSLIIEKYFDNLNLVFILNDVRSESILNLILDIISKRNIKISHDIEIALYNVFFRFAALKTKNPFLVRLGSYISKEYFISDFNLNIISDENAPYYNEVYLKKLNLWDDTMSYEENIKSILHSNANLIKSLINVSDITPDIDSLNDLGIL